MTISHASIGLGTGVREKTWYAIKEGADSLPKAFAERLQGRIRYGAEVVEIRWDDRSVSVTYSDSKTSSEVLGDHLICAIPFSTLRRIKIHPNFTKGKQDAIEQLNNASVVRVFIQCKERVWADDRWRGMIYTDLPIMTLVDSTFHQAGPTGIMSAYMSGANARAVRMLQEYERVDYVLEELKKAGLHSTIADKVDRDHCASKCWDEDQWSLGAYPLFSPGQLCSLMPHIARPEGRGHFAGDQTSAWPGWMQGALESGHRAACEVALNY